MNVISILNSYIQYYLSFDKLDNVIVKEYFEKIKNGNRLFIKTNLIDSKIIFFFLTKKFVKNDQFKKEWTKRGKKLVFYILLEKLDSHSDFNLNDILVFDLSETMSSVEKEKIIEKNKRLVYKLTNLSSDSKKNFEIILNKYSSNVYGANSERFELEQIEFISDDEVIVRTINRQNIEKIIIINWRKANTIAIIGNTAIKKKMFCWICHLNQIFCYQKESSKLIKVSKFCLFSKTGQLIRSVYPIDNSLFDVNSIFYNKNNLQVYLNVFNKSCYKRSILILSEKFNLMKTIDEDLFNPEFPLDFCSEIKILNIDYKMFHYNSNIAFLQSIDNYENIYIFDKSSYSFHIEFFQTNHKLIMVSQNKMLFKSKSCYLIQKFLFSKPHIFLDSDAFCKLNQLKHSHLLKNSYVLPCGNSACLECIYQQFNLFKQTLMCQICNQEHRLPKELKPVNKWVISNFVNENLFNILINENIKFYCYRYLI